MIGQARVAKLMLLLLVLGQQSFGMASDVVSLTHSEVRHTHPVVQDSAHTGVKELSELKRGRLEDKNVDFQVAKSVALKRDLASEGSDGNLAPNSSRSDFPCPSSTAIAPCVCTVDTGNNINLDCTNVESEDQLEAVFQQEFPVKELHGFYMASNDAIKIIWNILNGVSFQEIDLYPGPFSLKAVSEYFLLDSRNSLRYFRIEKSGLLSDGFPFGVLDDMESLESLQLTGSNFTWIPTINSPSIRTLYLEGGFIETIEPGTFDAVPSLSSLSLDGNSLTELRAGTVPIREGPMKFRGYDNELQVIEPGAFFFFDTDSANSSEYIYIYLTYNRIQALAAGTFSLRNGPVTILLYDNQIAFIEPGTFVLPEATGANSSEEIYIDLAPNRIQALRAGTFPLRNGPVTIILYGNQIASIEPGTFVLPEATNSFILSLDLHDNQLTTVDEAVFGDLMPFILTLDLSGNLLSCGCDIAWLVLSPDFMAKLTDSTKCADGTNVHDLNSQIYEDFC